MTFFPKFLRLQFSCDKAGTGVMQSVIPLIFVCPISGVLEEAKFFGLTSLIDILEDMIEVG